MVGEGGAGPGSRVLDLAMRQGFVCGGDAVVGVAEDLEAVFRDERVVGILHGRVQDGLHH